ncbi:hypothetical protein BDY19DRAFT_304741 [Irpex rosettiformis]|uniref:Uncharacterized protein n=1 Tax=Irpex rosettiformis TaxID=378272 RepID=A0ACB8TYT2_9APHY|nr:hypothetical protein BDY19DRAFT_304741 [Irpex rosettiformis]
MNFKLVFRALRRISLWSLEFYSDVHVEGKEHITKAGPLIVTPCHHNEIIDIATLTVTMPHRRCVCFWAKASMFKNPISGWILTSSGAIPVRRNPNSVAASGTNGNSNDSSQPNTNANEMHMSLFRGTFEALDIGEIIGLFPEGTSYTEPQIAQIKDGASYAALEYARWQHQDSHKNKKNMELTVVPVGIVYTNKSRYQSRVLVRFGEPIKLDFFAKRYLSAPDSEASRTVIKGLTAEVEKRLMELTINAPDWDTWFAASIARDIAWKGSENVPTKDWVTVSQNFIDLFTDAASTTSVTSTKGKKTLVAYYGLLHYTDISHDTLVQVYPSTALPSTFGALITFIKHLIILLVHPRFWLFLPAFLLHIPAYIIGPLAARKLAKPGEEETIAELTVVPAGLAYGITSWIASYKLANALLDGYFAGSWLSLPDILKKAGEWFVKEVPSVYGLKRVAATLTIMYWTTWVVFKWHSLLVKGNYRQYQRVLVSWKVLLGVLSNSTRDIPTDKLERYTLPPLPAANEYIKRRNQASDISDSDRTARSKVKSPGSTRLIRHLFAARGAAESVVRELSHCEVLEPPCEAIPFVVCTRYPHQVEFMITKPLKLVESDGQLMHESWCA